MISVSVRGVLVTTVFHTCTAPERTAKLTSLRAMYTRASTCGQQAAAQATIIGYVYNETKTCPPSLC
jgi:hypothetical protein